MRVLLFTGKGGVGKTTAAAATAYETARRGYKTLVMSTDPAHSLSDALDHKLGPEPVEVAPNFYGQELDIYYSMKKYWQNTKNLLQTIFKLQGFSNIVSEELSALPGMEEASAFLWIEKYYSEKAYDVIIIDSAPTGETLTFLTIPQVAQWWTSKAFPFQKLTVRTVGAAVRTFTGIPVDKGYEELDKLFSKLEKVQSIFSDPEICSIRVVVNPERMVINEAKRAYTYLLMYGYSVDAVIVNRVLPQIEGDSLFAKYVKSQAKYLPEIEEDFAPLPIFKVPHLGEEVFGRTLLEKIAQELYGKEDPFQIFHQENTFEIEEKFNRYIIKIKLPFIQDEKLSLSRLGNQLIIQVGNKRRNFFLPQFLGYFDMKEHKLKEDWLHVYFMKKD